MVPGLPGLGRERAGGAFAVALVPAAALPTLAEAAADLAARAAEPNVFYDPAFLGPALACFGGAVELAVVRSEGRLVGLLPLRRRPFYAEAWETPYVPFTAPLLDRGSADIVVAALLRALPRLCGARFLRLRLAAASGPSATALRDAARASGLRIAVLDRHERAMLPLDAAHDPQQRMPTRKRKEYARLRRRLAESGTLKAELAASEAAVAEAAGAYLALERAGWKGRRGTAMAQHDRLHRFFLDMTRSLAAEGCCRIAVLRLNGTPLAAAVALLSGHGAFYWKTAYDEAYARFSSGVLVTLDLGRALLAERRAEFVDSCAVPGHGMIEGVWDARRGIEDVLVALDPHLPGAVFGAVAALLRGARAGRAALKSAALRLARSARAPKSPA